MAKPEQQQNAGTILSVRSSVVEARFTERLPALNSILHTGDDGDIVVEVLMHIDEETVRGIALNSTEGLAQNSRIVDTGRPLGVSVGKELLGRVFNVFGEPIDNKEAISG